AIHAYRVGLGGSYCNYGNWFLNGERAGDSLAWFQKAIDTLNPVRQKEPRHLMTTRFLLNSHWNCALADDRLGKYAEAVTHWERGVELGEKVDQPRFRASRATSKCLAGKAEEAVIEVAELTKSATWDADQWYNFACVYSIASGKILDKKQKYAD